MRILYLGEDPSLSAPTLTLAHALDGLGFDAVFSHRLEERSTSQWLRLVRTVAAVVFVGYDGPGFFVIRQLALAAALGRPIIRWWVGSDVLGCLQSARLRRQAQYLNRFVALNIAVASHLVQELSSVGIKANHVPSVIEPALQEVRSPPTWLPTGVLVYLPSHRASFYGDALVRRVIEANPDLPFIIVADQAHRYAGCPNVESLGWVEPGRIYERIGCLLRLTEHDGMPRMVIESLLRGRYVIFNWEFPGCWQAKTFEDVQTQLRAFRRQTSFNHEGTKAVRRLLTPPPEERFARLLTATVRRRLRFWPLKGMAAVAALTLWLKTRTAAR